MASLKMVPQFESTFQREELLSKPPFKFRVDEQLETCRPESTPIVPVVLVPTNIYEASGSTTPLFGELIQLTLILPGCKVSPIELLA